MLIVHQLTKEYGAQKAIDNISFQANKGEIVGFLGPNGAGKSTTMKIATGYVAPTYGSVTVCDYDVAQTPLEAQKRIGYLPEHNPLYTEMYVREYLSFAGKLQGIKGQYLTKRIEEVIELVGLQRERHKKIAMLSKGYRQRVGLAQALLHNPEVLILDEPTTGLDPNQIIEIRNVIKAVSTDKTVVLSTHIMQEVQAICQRVVIINKGKLVADSPIADLLTEKQQILIEFLLPPPDTFFEGLNATKVNSLSPTLFVLDFAATLQDIRPLLFQRTVEQGCTLLTLQKQTQSMEHIFKQVTA